MSAEELVTLATKLGLVQSTEPTNPKEEAVQPVQPVETPKPAKRKKQQPEVKNPTEQRSYGQNKAIHSLLGFYAPFAMTKGLASKLISLASEAKERGSEVVALDEVTQDSLASLNDSYVSQWLADGCKLKVWAKKSEPKPAPNPIHIADPEAIEAFIADFRAELTKTPECSRFLLCLMQERLSAWKGGK